MDVVSSGIELLKKFSRRNTGSSLPDISDVAALHQTESSVPSSDFIKRVEAVESDCRCDDDVADWQSF